MPERIKWEHRTGPTRNSHVGTVNGKRLFTITYSISRRSTYTLGTTLPWAFQEGRDLGDVEELKVRAEAVLDAFVRKIGAVWPESKEGPHS